MEDETSSVEDQNFLDNLSEEDQAKIDEIMSLRERNEVLIEEVSSLGAGFPGTAFVSIRLDILLQFLAPEARIAYDLLVERELNIFLVNYVDSVRASTHQSQSSELIVPT